MRGLSEVIRCCQGDVIMANQSTEQATETLTAEQEEALAAIEAEDVSERQQAAMASAIECPGTCYTTTALVAMAQWLFEMGDARGSDMVSAFAREFARHEAVTL
jgi:hypothetical protein